MGSDLTLQTVDYRVMIIEQGCTRSELGNRKFLSCGLLDKVQNLSVFITQNKLELFLTGNVLVEGTTSTLTLEDFSEKDKITTTNVIVPEFEAERGWNGKGRDRC